jgi:hypothetical protein
MTMLSEFLYLHEFFNLHKIFALETALFNRTAKILSILSFLAIANNVTPVNISYYFKGDEEKLALTSSDKKNLDKAEKEVQKSAQFNKDADNIYNEVATKQAELTAEETEALNNKALKKQIDALKALEAANKTKYYVYVEKAAEFWKKYKGNPDKMGYAKSLETTGKSNFQAGEEQYKEAEGISDNMLAFSKMSGASDLLKSSVDDMKKAFDIYAGTPYTPSDSTANIPLQPDTLNKLLIPDTSKIIVPVTIAKPAIDTASSSNLYRAIKINEDMVDRFNKFLKNNYPANYEEYLVDFAALNYSDINAIRNAWSRYLYGADYSSETSVIDSASQKVIDSLKLASADTTKNPDLVSATATITSTNPVPVEESKISGNDIRGKKKYKKRTETEADSQKKPVQFVRKFADNEATVKGFSYRVQIVASRVPLNNETLTGIYSGTEQPSENYEDEWYKYSIGFFPSYESAREFRDQCGVQGAFIVAFVNGHKINSRNALIDSEQNSFSFTNFNIPENITFRVQIAACRNEMTAEELKKIFESPEQLETINEEGWFKYSINCRNDYAKACQILKSIAVEGAFIVAYNNGERVSLQSVFESISQPN